jgi:hypothetical protein
MRFSLTRYSRLSSQDKPVYIKRYLDGQKALARYELPIIRWLIRLALAVLGGALVVTTIGLLLYLA